MKMGLVGRSFLWVNAYGKKQCRSLFWRVRAALKKAAAKNGGKQNFTFQYDPCSYALNFDDGNGCCRVGEREFAFQNAKPHLCLVSNNVQWVYVICVKYD